MKAPITAILLLASCAAWAADPPKPPSNLRLNLNAAKAAELERLPGVDAARAKAIIKGRPYKSKEELLTKKILPQVVYEEMKANVFAGR